MAGEMKMEERENDPDSKSIGNLGRWNFKGETPFQFGWESKTNQNKIRRRV